MNLTHQRNSRLFSSGAGISTFARRLQSFAKHHTTFVKFRWCASQLSLAGRFRFRLAHEAVRPIESGGIAFDPVGALEYSPRVGQEPHQRGRQLALGVP
jgi:hypothetical protein